MGCWIPGASPCSRSHSFVFLRHLDGLPNCQGHPVPVLSSSPSDRFVSAPSKSTSPSPCDSRVSPPNRLPLTSATYSLEAPACSLPGSLKPSSENNVVPA